MHEIAVLRVVLFFACLPVYLPAQTEKADPIQQFVIMPGIHIRALEVLNDTTAWFAANRGVWGYTEDGGRSWQVDSIRVDTIKPGFRALSVLNRSTVLLLNAGSPAFLFKSTDKGKTWRTVYTDRHKDIFFDCLAFSDEHTGLALADPINGCFTILKTTDGGENWTKIECAGLPPAMEGEACFAASNSNLVMKGKNAWFVSGGKKSRAFFSDNNGVSFRSVSLPLPQGETMTGAYSMDFIDESTGVAAGGNYQRTDSTILSLAFTTNGGKSWQPVRTGIPFFGSCVRFVAQNRVIVTGHDGTFEVDLPAGVTTELQNEAAEPLKYHTLRLSPSGRYLWLGGGNGKVARIRL